MRGRDDDWCHVPTTTAQGQRNSRDSIISYTYNTYIINIYIYIHVYYYTLYTQSRDKIRRGHNISMDNSYNAEHAAVQQAGQKLYTTPRVTKGRQGGRGVTEPLFIASGNPRGVFAVRQKGSSVAAAAYNIPLPRSSSPPPLPLPRSTAYSSSRRQEH